MRLLPICRAGISTDSLMNERSRDAVTRIVLLSSTNTEIFCATHFVHRTDRGYLAWCSCRRFRWFYVALRRLAHLRGRSAQHEVLLTRPHQRGKFWRSSDRMALEFTRQ